MIFGMYLCLFDMRRGVTLENIRISGVPHIEMVTYSREFWWKSGHPEGRSAQSKRYSAEDEKKAAEVSQGEV